MRHGTWRRRVRRAAAAVALAAGLTTATTLALAARPTERPRLAAGGDAAARTPSLRTTVYFLTDDASAPIGVRRSLQRRSPHARLALAALLAGPTPAERARGLTTALPASARVISLRLAGRARERAVVDLAGLPPATAPGASTVLERIRAITQVARTLIGTSGIHEVRITAAGARWGLPRMRGGTAEALADYDRLLGWWRICSGQRSAAERRAGLSRCFAALP